LGSTTGRQGSSSGPVSLRWRNCGFEGLDERNNFTQRNFLRFMMEIELKIWELKVCFQI
jgi:hypothetical protein